MKEKISMKEWKRKFYSENRIYLLTKNSTEDGNKYEANTLAFPPLTSITYIPETIQQNNLKL